VTNNNFDDVEIEMDANGKCSLRINGRKLRGIRSVSIKNELKNPTTVQIEFIANVNTISEGKMAS